MDTSDIERWFARRIQIADDLVTKYSATFDAEILLCCALNALASMAWPGSPDRRRFVEFLVRFAAVTPPVTLVSVPLLTQRLEKQAQYAADAQALKKRLFPPPGLVITYKDIDRTETQLAPLVPTVPLPRIRKSSYASVIYSDLRSALIHEYSLAGDVAGHPLSVQDTIPHYVNVSEGIPPNMTHSKKLFLPYEYIRAIADKAISAACAYWQSLPALMITVPTKWWFAG